MPKTATVGLGVEFPSGSIVTTSGDLITSNIDVSGFAIDLDYTESDTALSGTFNGYGFDFSGPNLPSIVGVSLDPLSTFAPGDIGLSFDSDSVFVSGAGLFFTPSSRVLINIAFAPVPVPAAAWLLGSAVGRLGLMRRRAA